MHWLLYIGDRIMIFNTAYYHPMDKDYESKVVDDIGVGVKDIGMSVPMGISAGDVAGVNAKIRAGAGNIEIQFPGTVRGQRQAQTPGMYGKEQRQALEELRRANEINLSTHASFGIGGLAGQDQQGNFSDEQKKIVVDELKRAIEFAADTAKGGSVVVHSGEFLRPISEEPWAEGGRLFKHYKEEPEKAIIRVVDDRTGKVIQDVRKNQNIAVAKWQKAEKDHQGYYQFNSDAEDAELRGKSVMIKKGDYVDFEGNKIINPISVEHGRLPSYNKETGRFDVEMRSWDYFVEEAKEWNKLENERRARAGEPAQSEYDTITPEERYLRATLETREGYSRGWALQFSKETGEIVEGMKKLRDALGFYEKLEKGIPEDEKWKIMKQHYPKIADWTNVINQGLIPSERKTPTEILKEAIKQQERSLSYYEESGIAQEKEAKDSRETQIHIKSAWKYALDRSMDSYAEAGMHAYAETKKKKLSNPLTVTIENIFPEAYGAHPKELKKLIYGSRGDMAKMLKDQGIGEDEAKKLASQHIKATLDTGHLNVWRKHFQGTDEEFKKWMLKEVEDLAKNDLIGNMHLSDNYGYQDDHLSPGQGTCPVKEIVQIVKKHGYKGPMTVEPGADASTDLGDFHGLMKTWRYFGSPIYGFSGASGFPARNWQDVQYGYFGRTYPPYFIFGAYSPSNEWTLWSQVPME